MPRTIADWKDKIENSKDLLIDAIEGMAEEEKIKGVAADQRIDALMRSNMCGSFIAGFNPANKHSEGLEDNFDEVIQAYAEHMAEQEESELMESAIERANDSVAASFADCQAR